MKWIKNHKLISFFVFVIIVSFGILIMSVVSGGSGNAVTSSTNGIINIIEKPFVKLGDFIYDNVSGVFTYKKIQSENDELKKENEKLKEQVTKLTLTANQLKELKSLSNVLNYNGLKDDDSIVSADVVSMDGTNWMNIFTINRGSESEISVGDVVMCGDGLVGRISDVGAGWSKVVSIIDESVSISFKVSGNLQLIGVVSGSSDGTLSGFMLDSKAKVTEGDRIITSGMGIYPAGIAIGKVTKVNYDSDAQLQKVSVKPSVEFMSLQKVSVII